MNKWISKEDACKVAEPYGAFRNAAPDLLAALKVIVEVGGIGPDDMFDDARDAIARAEGDQCD